MRYRFYTALVKEGKNWDRKDIRNEPISAIMVAYDRYLISYENISEVKAYEFDEKEFYSYLENLTDKSVTLQSVIEDIGDNQPTLTSSEELTTFESMESSFYVDIWDTDYLHITGGNLAIPNQELSSSFVTDLIIESKANPLTYFNAERLVNSTLFFVDGLAVPSRLIDGKIYLPQAARKLARKGLTNVGMFSFAPIEGAMVKDLTYHITGVKEVQDESGRVFASEVAIVDNLTNFYETSFNVCQIGHYGSFNDSMIEIVDKHTLKLTVLHDVIFHKLHAHHVDDRVDYKKGENYPFSGNITEIDIKHMLSQHDSFLILLPKDIMTREIKLVNEQFNRLYRINDVPNGIIVKEDGRVFNHHVTDNYHGIYTLAGGDCTYTQLISDTVKSDDKSSTLFTTVRTYKDQVVGATMHQYYRFDLPE